MVQFKYIGILGMAFFLLSGCATKSKQCESDLDRTVKLENPANNPSAIGQRAAEVFASAPGLTDEQKQKLLAIYSRTYIEASEIRIKMGKGKSLLFKLVASVNYKSKDVEDLKNKIVSWDKKRLDIMFKALADVQAVVGYGHGKEELYEHLRNYQTPGNFIIGSESETTRAK